MNLPTHIGGYQHLAPDVIVEEGDIWVQDGKPVAFVGVTLNYPMRVRRLEMLHEMNIYRKIPVAKQGDSHRAENPPFKIAADGVKLWRSKDGSYSPSGFMDDGPNELSATLPADAKARKKVSLATGLLDYFPDALCAVAELSRIGNDQHNPGKPLHWDRSKSSDEADALMRHLIERDGVDSDGVLHAVKVAWRGLALAQKKIEAMRSCQTK